MAWQQGKQVGTNQSQQAIYRWYDPDSGQSREQHVSPGSGRAPGQGAPEPARSASGKALSPSDQKVLGQVQQAARADLADPAHPMNRFKGKLVEGSFAEGLPTVRTVRLERPITH